MDVSDIFYFFSARRRGRGSLSRQEGGVVGFFVIENPRTGGGGLLGEGGGARGREGVCREFGGGG